MSWTLFCFISMSHFSHEEFHPFVHSVCSYRDIHYNNWRRFQNSNLGDRWRTSETANLGHGRSGEISHDHVNVCRQIITILCHYLPQCWTRMCINITFNFCSTSLVQVRQSSQGIGIAAAGFYTLDAFPVAEPTAYRYGCCLHHWDKCVLLRVHLDLVIPLFICLFISDGFANLFTLIICLSVSSFTVMVGLSLASASRPHFWPWPW